MKKKKKADMTKKEIDAIIKKVIDEYGETIRLLGE